MKKEDLRNWIIHAIADRLRQEDKYNNIEDAERILREHEDTILEWGCNK